jgi:hypothetical protein
MPLTHAKESLPHIRGKQDLGRLLSRREFLVLYEHMLADVVAFRRAKQGLHIVCGQHDRRTHTVRRNVQRDFANGCHAMVILVPNKSARAAARRLLRREFPRSVWTRVGIITYATCSALLAREVPAAAVAVNPTIEEP